MYADLRYLCVTTEGLHPPVRSFPGQSLHCSVMEDCPCDAMPVPSQKGLPVWGSHYFHHHVLIDHQVCVCMWMAKKSKLSVLQRYQNFPSWILESIFFTRT